MNYPKTYHAACAELVAFGASDPGRAVAARCLIACALRDLRKLRGAEFTRQARMGMLFISGHFPDNPRHPWRPARWTS